MEATIIHDDSVSISENRIPLNFDSLETSVPTAV